MSKYAIIDVETTGGSPRFERITEVGIVLYDGQQVLETFSSLINPERTIPDFIVKLTGITNEMVADAPYFYEIAKQIVEMTEGAIFVAHNARFDYGFIRAEFNRLGYTYTRRQLCTVKLSRRVMPGLPSYSLKKLCGHLDIALDRHHRALEDAMAATRVLEYMLAKEASPEQVKALVNRGIRETRLPEGITLDQLHQIPESCGVYYLHDADGKVVYVGKSINIQKRVMSHFAGKNQKGNRIHRHVRNISWEVTGSELVALLMESHEIKRLTPLINRAQRLKQFPWIVHTYVDDRGYQCFGLQKASRKEREQLEVLCDFPKKGAARGYLQKAVETFGLCRRLSGLEKPVGSCMYYQLQLCQGGCQGVEPPRPYNERAQKAAQQLGVLFDRDFLLVDQGRSPDEQAVVMVEHGEYQGYGFFPSDLSPTPTQVKNHLRKQESNTEVLRIIRHFLLKSKEVQYIPLNPE